MSGRSIRLAIGDPGDGRRRGRRGDRDQHRHVAQGRPAPPRDRADLPLWRAGDLGPRARQPDRPADDPGRADLVHRDPRRSHRSRSSTSSRSRSRTPPRSSSSALVLCLSERPARDTRRSGRRRDPGRRRHGTQHPLLDEPHAHRRQEQWPLRWPGAGDHDERRRASAAGSSRRLARVGSCCPSSWPAWSSSRRSSSTSSGGSPTCPRTSGPSSSRSKDLAPAAIPVALLIGFYRQSERRLQALVDAIPDRMFRFARDGRYVDARAGDRRRTDAAETGALIGRQLHELMFAAAIRHGPGLGRPGPRQRRTPGLRLLARPSERPARLRGADRAERPDEVTAIVRDFTDQRAAEAELRRSRARIVEATDAERRRLERDLHDGAQQRLVSLSLALRLLRARLGAAGGAERRSDRRRGRRPLPSSRSRSRSCASSPAASTRRS